MMARPTLLIVGDIPDSVQHLSQLLSQDGFSLRQADSTRAVAEARRMQPDLILLADGITGADGCELCRELRGDKDVEQVPVIAVCGPGDGGDRGRLFEAGAADYIAHPIQAAEVLARVRGQLALRLGNRLQQRIAERDIKIAELEAYAHTVAHDLRNPINVIATYATIIADCAEGVSSTQVGDYARRILAGTHKMTAMINSLLLLASARQDDVKLGPLDMEAIVAEALQRLEGEIEQSRAEIRMVSQWPVGLGYAPWVEEVWTNYLSNAIKYGGRADKKPPVSPQIEIGAMEQADGFVRYSVADNGRGITPEDQKRLFLPFDRLGRSRVEGFGLGLSIVQRIVERLGGQVGVDSAPERGSTFSFTLRRAD